MRRDAALPANPFGVCVRSRLSVSSCLRVRGAAIIGASPPIFTRFSSLALHQTSIHSFHCCCGRGSSVDLFVDDEDCNSHTVIPSVTCRLCQTQLTHPIVTLRPHSLVMASTLYQPAVGTVRQPFAPLNSSRLQTLTSLKNRQNGKFPSLPPPLSLSLYPLPPSLHPIPLLPLLQSIKLI